MKWRDPFTVSSLSNLQWSSAAPFAYNLRWRDGALLLLGFGMPRKRIMRIFNLRGKPPTALLLVFLVSSILPACSMTDDIGEYSLRYELCDDADTGNMDCPG